jgi:hypothetical protein
MISLVTTPPAPSAPPWTVRSSVEAAFRLGLQNFTSFAVVALIFTTPGFVLEMRGVGGIPKFVADILGDVAAYICILCGALQALDEHLLSVQNTLWQIHRPALPKLLVFGAVQSTLIALGTILLVAPGLYLMTIWMVAMPALLVEDGEIVDAFRQSAELTRGRRWRVFGAGTVCVLAAIVAFGFVSLGLRTIPIMSERFELQAWLHWLTGAVVLTFVYPVSAVLYVLLREEKEGLSVSQIVGTLH